MVLSDIAELCARFELEPEHIDTFCQRSGITRSLFFDNLAKYVAHGYAEQKLSFEFCDSVINEAWRISECDLPSYAYAVYEAFEEGEYYHADDSHEIEPHEIYTRPLINQIVANE